MTGLTIKVGIAWIPTFVTVYFNASVLQASGRIYVGFDHADIRIRDEPIGTHVRPEIGLCDCGGRIQKN